MSRYQKDKTIWILMQQETVSGSGISWAICISASRYRQITMPAPHHSVFLQAGCPSCRPTNSVKALKAARHQMPFSTKKKVATVTVASRPYHLVLPHGKSTSTLKAGHVPLKSPPSHGESGPRPNTWFLQHHESTS